MKKILITIVGPTAVGKTDLAINLAQNLNTEIVSADSRQFYRELNIGTTKPSEEELLKAKHHLINNKSINEKYNISQFQKDADKIINEIFYKNDFAILVGGSGLYIDTILYGIDNIPYIDPSIREKLNREYNLNGLNNLLKQLSKIDPKSIKTIDLKNHRRIIRALEVSISTKKPYSSFLKSKNKKKSRYNELIIGLNKERIKLHHLIDIRVDEMIKNGLLDEVKSLIRLQDLNTLNTIGYSEIFKYYKNEYTIEEAIEKIKINSRRYAKRQLTWFKSNKNINWFKNEYKVEEILKLIKSIQLSI